MIAFSHAQAGEPVVWNCWYDADGGFRLTCDLPDPELAWEPVPDGSESEVLRAQWRDAVLSNQPSLAASLVRRHPVEFAAMRVYIPLYGPPDEDLRRAQRLARAVLCARHPLCSVAFDPTPAIRDLRSR